jgi:2-polyprenyl-3-methyl-5-hydroxy-6-metoxy-1,4-benzoquinol methylase
MKRHGAQCGPAEFHAAVNVTFHQFESEVYDTEHADMWNSLPQQFALFAQDCLHQQRYSPQSMRVLDIGCGTGLASQSLLNSVLGERIASVDLLDTSSEMLRRAGKRAAGWRVPVETHEGLIDALPPGRKYDLIVTCSVLHHVPDLAHFVDEVRKHQAEGGIFLHLQDPNGDHANDPELKKRMAEFSRKLLPETLYRFTPKRVYGKLHRVLTGTDVEDYVFKTNQKLLQSGIVTSPLTVQEIYAITDIHVADGDGISICKMKAWMADYELLSTRSYGFFGVLWDTLPPRLRVVEEQLIQAGAQNGLHVGAAWKLK